MYEKRDLEVTGLGASMNMNNWCPQIPSFLKMGELSKLSFFLFKKSNLYSNDPCILQWILPQEIFSKNACV